MIILGHEISECGEVMKEGFADQDNQANKITKPVEFETVQCETNQ